MLLAYHNLTAKHCKTKIIMERKVPGACTYIRTNIQYVCVFSLMCVELNHKLLVCVFNICLLLVVGSTVPAASFKILNGASWSTPHRVRPALPESCGLYL